MIFSAGNACSIFLDTASFNLLDLLYNIKLDAVIVYYIAV